MNKERKPMNRKLLIPVAVLLAALLLIPTTHYRSTRVGFVESGGWSRWTARYHSLDGTLSRTLHPKDAAYLLTVTTDSGTLSITVQCGQDEVFCEENLPTGTWPLTLTGKAEITVTADNHSGSFSLTPVA